MAENKNQKISTRAAVARAKIQAAIRREVEQRGGIMTPAQRTQATFYTDEEGQVIGGEVPQVSAGGQVIGGQSFGADEAKEELKKIEREQAHLEAVESARGIAGPKDTVSFSGLQSTTPELQIKAATKGDITWKEYAQRFGIEAGKSGLIFGTIGAIAGAPAVALAGAGYGAVSAYQFQRQSQILSAYYGGSTANAAKILGVSTVKSPEFLGGLVGGGVGTAAGLRVKTAPVSVGRFRTAAVGLDKGRVVAVTRGVVTRGGKSKIVESVAAGKEIKPARIFVGEKGVSPPIDIWGYSTTRTRKPGSKGKGLKGFDKIEGFLGVKPRDQGKLLLQDVRGGWTGVRGGITKKGVSAELATYRLISGKYIYESGIGAAASRKGRDPLAFSPFVAAASRKGRDPLAFQFERIMTKREQKKTPYYKLNKEIERAYSPTAQPILKPTKSKPVKPGKPEISAALEAEAAAVRASNKAINKFIAGERRVVSFGVTSASLTSATKQRKSPAQKQAQKRKQAQERAFEQRFNQMQRSTNAQSKKLNQRLKLMMAQPLMQKQEVRINPALITPSIAAPGAAALKGFITGKRGATKRKGKRKKARQPKKYKPSLTAAFFDIRASTPKKITGLEIRPLAPLRKKKIKKRKRRKKIIKKRRKRR